jgi:predicted acetyltransferase
MKDKSEAPRIRPLGEADREAYAALKDYAFRSYPSSTAEHPGDTEKLRFATGVFDGDRLVSMMSVLPYEMAFRGRWVQIAGVNAVASYPEARGRGYVRLLFEHLFSALGPKAPPVSILLPFRDSFYSKFGYVSTDRALPLRVQPAALAAAAGASTRRPRQVRRAAAPGERAAYAQALRSFRGLHGAIAPPASLDDDWRNRTRDWALVLIEGDEKLCAGYLMKKDGMGRSSTMSVRAIHYSGEQSRRMLMAHLGTHRDQFPYIELSLPANEPPYDWAFDTTEPPLLGSERSMPAWQARLTNVKPALDGLPAPAAGEVDLVVDDPHCPWNAGRFALRSAGDALSVEAVLDTRNRSAPEEVRLPIDALTAIAFGSTSLDRVCARWSIALTDGAAGLLEAWFPRAVLYNDYYF